MSALTGCRNDAQTLSTPPTTETVTIIIYGDRANEPTKFLINEVADGTTLESVMRLIDEIEMEIKGSGTTAFVESISDQKNDAARGWTFKVDGDFANQGIGSTALHPPTTVEWTYGDFQM